MLDCVRGWGIDACTPFFGFLQERGHTWHTFWGVYINVYGSARHPPFLPGVPCFLPSYPLVCCFVAGFFFGLYGASDRLGHLRHCDTKIYGIIS